MRYVAAYLLAVLGGNEAPSTKDLKAILESVGVGYDDERATAVCEKLAGKSIEEVDYFTWLTRTFCQFWCDDWNKKHSSAELYCWNTYFAPIWPKFACLWNVFLNI